MIEQEAGIGEYDSRDRPFIWGLTGGEQRIATGLADRFVDDDTRAIRHVVAELAKAPVPATHRSERYGDYLRHLADYDAGKQADPDTVRRLYGDQGDHR